MSSKVVLATVALAAVVASTDAKFWESVRSKLDLAALGKKTPHQKALAHKHKPVPKASLMDEYSEAVQKIKWGKVVKGINTGLDIVGKAKSVGLFEEDEKRGPTSWEINGGASNGGKWNIGGKISGSFDEEEEVQKLQLDLRKATKTLASAEKLGLLDEDAELDEAQKLKLGKVIKGAVKVVKVAGAVGLLEEEDVVELAAPIHKLIKCTFGRNLPLDEETEEDLQKLKINLKKVVQGVNTGLDLFGKAKSVGLFEEQKIIYNPGRPRSVPMDSASFEETHWDPPSTRYFDEEAESVLDCTTPPKNCEFNRACAYWALYCKEQQASFEEEQGWGDIRPIPIMPDLIRPIKFDEEEGWNDIRPIPIAPELIRPIKFEEDEIYQINPGLPRVVKFEEGIIRDNWVPYTNKFERDIAVEKLHRLNKLQHPKK